MRKFPIVAFDAPLQKVVEKLLDSQATHFSVVKEDTPIATLSRDEIIKGLQKEYYQIAIEKVADPEPLKLDINLPLEGLLKKWLPPINGWLWSTKRTTFWESWTRRTSQSSSRLKTHFPNNSGYKTFVSAILF